MKTSPGSSQAVLVEQRADVLHDAYHLLGSAIDQVEERLSHTYESTVKLIPEVSRHLIGSGGKRIRPVLLLLMAKAVGVELDRAIDLAVATELLHNATLLHDDVVDRGEMRRGAPSAPRVFGNSASVLVGDFLMARSLQLVVTHGDLLLLDEFSRMLSSLAEGEVLQLLRSGRFTISLPDYVEIVSGKTAGLFSWCCRAGASLGHDSARLGAAAARFGQAFGMAFQITDDILDYVASPDQSGKDLSNDLRQGKATLPLLLACEEDDQLYAIIEEAAEGEPGPVICQTIVDRVLKGKGIDRAGAEAGRYRTQALQELAAFSEPASIKLLKAMADFVVDRTRPVG